MVLVVAYGNNVGKINSLKTIEHGKNMKISPAPTLSFFKNILVVDQLQVHLWSNIYFFWWCNR